MRFTELRLSNLRNIEAARIELAPGINVFTGANGAGKTTVLEGAYLLSHARSFRTSQSEFLQRRGTQELAIFGVIEFRSGEARLGLRRLGGRWSARINNDVPTTLVELLRRCAVVCFEPGSHALISGASEERRRFLDWGVFHVEPDYPGILQRYRRALQQRNALLKRSASPAEIAGWDEELVRASAPLSSARGLYFEQFSTILTGLLRVLVPELGAVMPRYSRGWDEGQTLAQALSETRELDRARTYTARGPHRADWTVHFELAPSREQLSRGQEKLCAIACMLAQAQLFQTQHGEWPIVVLDDLASELDSAHQRTVVEMLRANAMQVLMTGTTLPESLTGPGTVLRQFHVEQGTVSALV